MASTNSRPTLRSVSWARWLPIPSPTGITEKARKAGIIMITGASPYRILSALLGRTSSLKNSLMPSARVWSTPKGPTRLGPTRVCMKATMRRSSQMVSSTVTIRAANTPTTLTSMMNTSHTVPLIGAPPRGSPNPSGRSCRRLLHRRDRDPQGRGRPEQGRHGQVGLVGRDEGAAGGDRGGHPDRQPGRALLAEVDLGGGPVGQPEPAGVVGVQLHEGPRGLPVQVGRPGQHRGRVEQQRVGDQVQAVAVALLGGGGQRFAPGRHGGDPLPEPLGLGGGPADAGEAEVDP